MIQPLGRQVCIKPDAKEEVTKGGIYVPPPSQHNNNIGTVVSIGNHVEEDEVTAGDRVRYNSKGSLPQEDGSLLVSVDNILWKE